MSETTNETTPLVDAALDSFAGYWRANYTDGVVISSAEWHVRAHRRALRHALAPIAAALEQSQARIAALEADRSGAPEPPPHAEPDAQPATPAPAGGTLTRQEVREKAIGALLNAESERAEAVQTESPAPAGGLLAALDDGARQLDFATGGHDCPSCNRMRASAAHLRELRERIAAYVEARSGWNDDHGSEENTGAFLRARVTLLHTIDRATARTEGL